MYIDVEAIRSRLPQVPITANSKPNEGQVDDFIEAVEGEVNAILAAIGYSTPVTGDPALIMVREIVTTGVIARTLNTRDLGVRDPETGGGAHQQRRYDRFLERLQDRRDPLNLKGDAVVPREHVTVRSQAITESTDTTQPIFSLDQEF